MFYIINILNNLKISIKQKTYISTMKYDKNALLIIKLFWNWGLLHGYSIKKKKIFIYFKFYNNKNVIININILSTPTNKFIYNYINLSKLNKSKNSLYILSSSIGIISNYTAIKYSLGGILLAEIQC